MPPETIMENVDKSKAKFFQAYYKVNYEIWMQRYGRVRRG